MGVGTAPEGTVAVTPPYTFVIWPRISSSFRSRRMVFFGHAENLAQLVDTDGFARDHILLYGVQSADLHFHAAP